MSLGKSSILIRAIIFHGYVSHNQSVNPIKTTILLVKPH